jgi:hypothetical protein
VPRPPRRPPRRAGSPATARSSSRRPTPIKASSEDAWIRENYPGAIKEGQSLLKCNDKPADAIHIVTANGQKVTVYFDISGWFGKW